MNERNKNTILNFSRNKINWAEKWGKVIFWNEKKFNLDGFDGYSYYNHDLRKDELMSKCQIGEGSVFFLVCNWLWKTELSFFFFLDGRINALKYINLLIILKSCFRQIAERYFIFQQDNTLIHTAHIKLWFET